MTSAKTSTRSSLLTAILRRGTHLAGTECHPDYQLFDRNHSGCIAERHHHIGDQLRCIDRLQVDPRYSIKSGYRLVVHRYQKAHPHPSKVLEEACHTRALSTRHQARTKADYG